MSELCQPRSDKSYSRLFLVSMTATIRELGSSLYRPTTIGKRRVEVEKNFKIAFRFAVVVSPLFHSLEGPSASRGNTAPVGKHWLYGLGTRAIGPVRESSVNKDSSFHGVL